MAETRIVQLLSVTRLSMLKGDMGAEGQPSSWIVPVVALALLGDGSVRPIYLDCSAGESHGPLGRDALLNCLAE